MKQLQYRFNRAEGKIYQNNRGKLTEIGESLDMIILHATDPIYGDPFDQNRPQNWVQLCFLDSEFNWCHALLNSGNSGALNDWLCYQQKLERANQNLWEVMTKISFIPVMNSYRDKIWYYYNFEKNDLSSEINVAKIMNSNRHLPLIDRDINLPFSDSNFIHPLLESNSVDERAKFVCWS